MVEIGRSLGVERTNGKQDENKTTREVTGVREGQSRLTLFIYHLNISTAVEL